MPVEIEAILRILAVSSSLEIPRLDALWEHRMQLSAALAFELCCTSDPGGDNTVLQATELSSVVTIQDEHLGTDQPGMERLALALDAELEIPEGWHGIAEQYGKALRPLGLKQHVNPAYLLVFRHEGNVFGLTGSLLAYERAFKATLNHLAAESPIHLEALASVHLKKFEKWHGRTDIDDAVTCFRACLRATEETNPRYLSRLTSLCHVLQLRAITQMDISDVGEAFRLLQRSELTVMKSDIRSQKKHRNALTLVNFASWALDKSSIDYREVLESFVEASQDESLDSRFLVSSASHYIRTLLWGPVADAARHHSVLKDFASVLVTVLTTMAEDNPTLIPYWSLAADLYLLLFQQSGASDIELGERAMVLYRGFSNNTYANPESRIHSAYLSASLSEWLREEALVAHDDMQAAYLLLPEAIPEGLIRQDQLEALRRLSYIPSAAAAVALSAGVHAGSALRILETGRGIIWNSLLNSKSSIDKLQQEHAALAQEYMALQSRLGGSDSLVVRQPTVDLDHHFHAARLHKLLGQIRTHDGFEDFLRLPAGLQELEKFGSCGPVIAINVTNVRADALIITESHGISSHGLPDVTSRTCESQMAMFKDALAHITVDQEEAASLLAPVLEWLWDAVALPVLDNIPGFREAEQTPRIWWVTTGPFNVLPIHAAGNHQKAKLTGEPCTLIDRAICSYIPTLRALDFVRKSQDEFLGDKSSEHDIKALLVPVSKTPNMSDIEHADREVDAVEELFVNAGLKCPIEITKLPKACCQDVLDALRCSTIAHFACHAKVNESDPSKSRLCLRDWGVEPLEVATLMEEDLTRCQVVFLSACETAVNKDLKLGDEGLHIAGGFQMSGIPNTVATWWEVEDRYPVNVATSFYKSLIQGGHVDTTRCAVSLRDAVNAMRKTGIDPLIWGAYVHFGA